MESLLDLVPDQAAAAIVMRRPAFQLLRTFMDSDQAMRAELGDYLEHSVGLDLTRLEGAVVFSTNLTSTPTFGMILRLPGAVALKQKPVGSFQGVSLYDLGGAEGGKDLRAAIVPAGVAVGSESEVKAAIALGQRASKPIGTGSALGVLFRDDLRGADLAMAVRVGSIQDASLQAQAQRFGVDQVTFTYRDGLLVLSAQGDGSKLGIARDLLRGGMAVGVQEVEQKKQQAVQGHDQAEAVAAIVAAHTVRKMVEEASPVLSGNELQMRYRLPALEMTSALPLLGVMSALAVPAFSKYSSRAKAVEGRSRLRVLRGALEGYYEEHKGKAFSFPTSVGWTPGVSCCGQPGNKCQPDEKMFRHPTWQALSFSLDEPHVYQYRLTSTGKGKTARVVVEARADAGCNGTMKTQRMEGRIDDSGALKFTGPGESED